MKQCSRKMVLSIKVSLRTRGIGGSKEGERERALRASAIILVAETEARLRVMTQSTTVAMKPSCRDRGATGSQSKYRVPTKIEVCKERQGRKMSARGGGINR